MVCEVTTSRSCSQPRPSFLSPAHEMAPSQRRQLAVDTLAGVRTVSSLARENRVSRKFVYRQAAVAEEALDEVFGAGSGAAAGEKRVLFSLPVTKSWLRQAVLGLTLTCHSSSRGVVEFFHDLLDCSISVGTVHTILQAAVERARPYNLGQDLSGVRIGAHDEIFQNGQPVLVGADVASTYCYLLSLEEHRDAETWGIRLLELQEQGFAPQATIADAGQGLRAGQALAMPGVPCRGDVFHALKDGQALVTFLENRAYAAIGVVGDLGRKKARLRWRGQRIQSVALKLARAEREESKSVALADDAATLLEWLRKDVLALAGPDHRVRRELFDFVVAELRLREPLCPHRIGPLARALSHQRDDLLAFATQLDVDLAALAAEFQSPVETVRALLHVQVLDAVDAARWPREHLLRSELGNRFFPLREAVDELAGQTVRASSLVENLNSRLRNYFFLRRQLGPDYLALLQFFLNHRRFPRSQRSERVGKSPAELLRGAPHPHWLEMLGYRRFSRN
jgi:hypothetical protein